MTNTPILDKIRKFSSELAVISGEPETVTEIVLNKRLFDICLATDCLQFPLSAPSFFYFRPESFEYFGINVKCAEQPTGD